MNKFIYLLLLVCLTVNAQDIKKKCKTCGEPIAQCKYKGNHPSNTNNITTTNPQNKETPSRAIDLGLPSGTKWAEWNIGGAV